MDSFDNFQYESASSYGPLGVLDDNSSVYTANTHETTSLDLETLSFSDPRGASVNGHVGSKQPTPRIPLDEDFDGVLDDLKEENAVVLPPHACRSAPLLSNKCCFRLTLFTPRQLLRDPFTRFSRQVSRLLQMVLQLSRQHVRFSHRQPSRARQA
jgi:hypothetical protein